MTMPDDDVLTRAKDARRRFEECRDEYCSPHFGRTDLEALIALAESQARQLAEIREQCVSFTPDPDLAADILTILDRNPQ